MLSIKDENKLQDLERWRFLNYPKIQNFEIINFNAFIIIIIKQIFISILN